MENIYELEFNATSVLHPWIKTEDIQWSSEQQECTVHFEIQVPCVNVFSGKSTLKRYKLIVQEIEE